MGWAQDFFPGPISEAPIRIMKRHAPIPCSPGSAEGSGPKFHPDTYRKQQLLTPESGERGSATTHITVSRIRFKFENDPKLTHARARCKCCVEATTVKAPLVMLYRMKNYRRRVSAHVEIKVA